LRCGSIRRTALSETRKTLAAFSRDGVSRMSTSVVVAEGGGFRSALVRAVGVTLTTILPHSSKFRFVNDLVVGHRRATLHDEERDNGIQTRRHERTSNPIHFRGQEVGRRAAPDLNQGI
jgi:hypothetical protein